MKLRLATYNVGGGRRGIDPAFRDVGEVIGGLGADVVVLQEATDWQNADGEWFSWTRWLTEADGFADGYFAPVLTMSRHMHPRKAAFIQASFDDLREWRQGNAILSRFAFTQLGAPPRPGRPRDVRLFEPAVYAGTRDTEPRHCLLARLNVPPHFPYVVGVHLTTLDGERGEAVDGEVRKRAQQMRLEQVELLVGFIQENILDREQPVIVLGDFNATADEPCIRLLETECGFLRLQARCADGASDAIDHILVSPRARVIDYECQVYAGEPATTASDHLPVVATIEMAD